MGAYTCRPDGYSIPLNQLYTCLCELATGPRDINGKDRYLMPEMCQRCEAQCVYGKRLLLEINDGNIKVVDGKMQLRRVRC